MNGEAGIRWKIVYSKYELEYVATANKRKTCDGYVENYRI